MENEEIFNEKEMEEISGADINISEVKAHYNHDNAIFDIGDTVEVYRDWITGRTNRGVVMDRKWVGNAFRCDGLMYYVKYNDTSKGAEWVKDRSIQDATR